MSSKNTKDNYTPKGSLDIKFHYDFLRFDLQARSLRYCLHEHIIEKVHDIFFNSQTKPLPIDMLVQDLILAKQNDAEWVLTSEQS